MFIRLYLTMFKLLCEILIFYIYFSAGYLDDPDSNVVFYFLLKAVDKFYTQYHRYPGTFD